MAWHAIAKAPLYGKPLSAALAFVNIMVPLVPFAFGLFSRMNRAAPMKRAQRRVSQRVEHHTRVGFGDLLAKDAGNAPVDTRAMQASQRPWSCCLRMSSETSGSHAEEVKEAVVPSGAVGVQRVPALGPPAFSDAVAFQDKMGPAAALAELGAHHQTGLAATDDQGFDFLDGHGAVLFRVGKTDARVARLNKLVRAARLFIEKRPDRPQPALGHNAPSQMLNVAGVDPDGFATRDQMADYFTAYAAKSPPIRCGVAVTALHRKPDGTGFQAETSAGAIEATNVVAATGPFQRGSSRPWYRRTPASRRCIPPPTATPTSCHRARCWWSAPAPPHPDRRRAVARRPPRLPVCRPA